MSAVLLLSNVNDDQLVIIIEVRIFQSKWQDSQLSKYYFVSHAFKALFLGPWAVAAFITFNHQAGISDVSAALSQ